MNGVDSLMEGSTELISLPAVTMQALQLIANPTASAGDIGDIISQDPGMTARLLKIVNSPFYGFPSRVETVSRAITILGTLELTDLVLGTSAMETFDRIPGQVIDMQDFWSHSLYTAVTSRIIADQLRSPGTERCFVMGLLHDIGLLLMATRQPDLVHQALELSRRQAIPLEDAEHRLSGFNHAEAGAALMQAWNLPESFYQVSLHHHRPLLAGTFALETAVVHIADAISSMRGHALDRSGITAPIEPQAWAAIGLHDESAEPIGKQADALFAEAEAALLPRGQAA